MRKHLLIPRVVVTAYERRGPGRGGYKTWNTATGATERSAGAKQGWFALSGGESFDPDCREDLLKESNKTFVLVYAAYRLNMI